MRQNNKIKSSFYPVRRMMVLMFALFVSGINTQAQEPIEEPVEPAISKGENTVTLRGSVISPARGYGFAGVRISVVDTRITTMTSEDGTFELQVPHLEVTLSVDAPGYQNQIVSLQGRNEIKIKILENTVPSFYDETIFSPNSVKSVSVFSDGLTSIDEEITSRLLGEVRAITHSGMPGNGAAVFTRGLNSLNATSQPLYVVDGVIWQTYDGAGSIHEGIFNNPLSLINPDDVANIKVLKDGTSIYGSKGGNGVIFIETKRAQTMATEVSLNISMGYRAPVKSIPVMNADESRLYLSDILSTAFDNTSYVDNFKFLNDDPTTSYYKANHNRTNWLDLVGRGAWVQNYGISVRGGDEIALYAISVGYNKSEGNIKETDFSRMNVRFNSDINISKDFKLLFDITFAQTNSNVRNDGMNETSSPYYLSLIKSPFYNPYEFNQDGSVSKRLSDVDDLDVSNPLALLDKGNGVSKRYRFNMNIKPSYTIREKLTFSFLFGYGWDKLNESSFQPDGGITDTPLYNEFGEMYATSYNYVQDRMDRQSSMTLDGRIDWKILQNTHHKLTAYGGYRFYMDSYDLSFGAGHNTGSDNVPTLGNTDPELRTTTGINDNWNSMSWYVNADYSYLNRYLLNVSSAMDASSLFGKNAKGAMKFGGVSWGLFPSASAGWIISSEKFMKNVSFVNFLKLSAGYSVAGNDNLPNYVTRSYFTSEKFMGNAMGLLLSNIGNDKLKWETTEIGKIGLDFSLFNNRWSVNADVYTSKTKDLLTQKQLKEEAGLKYYWSNDGELENKGFEISTNVRILNLQDWKLDMGASIGHYKNKITSLANGSFISDIAGAQVLTMEGQPAGVFWGYKTNGVFSTVQEAEDAGLYIRTESGQLISFEAGDMRFEEVEKDYIIDEKDKQIIGDPNPDFYGNFNFTLAWKNFSLGALFTYSYGNDAYNALRANLEAGTNLTNQSTSMQNRWVANGQKTDIPRAVYGDPMGNARFSDRWIEDASYLRFKSLSLSYRLPLNLSYIQGLTIWGSVNNLCTFTNYLGADPEFSYGNSILYQGVDAGLTPLTRSFHLGVKINL